MYADRCNRFSTYCMVIFILNSRWTWHSFFPFQLLNKKRSQFIRMWLCMCTASVKLISHYWSKIYTSFWVEIFLGTRHVMSSCWAWAICSGRFKEVLEKQDKQAHLNPHPGWVCLASFTLQGLHCSMSQGEKKV